LRKFAKPRIVSSKCIEFEPCRYNGLIIRSSVVENLQKYAEFHPVCPEVGIGLGIPRDPVRVVEADGKMELFQPATEKIFTKEMQDFSESFLNSLPDIDGFILKNRSPSCGIKKIKVYHGFKNPGSRRGGVGLFAQKVRDKFPDLPLEDEGRLRNLAIRENYLTRLFTLADFRKINEKGDFNDLIDFQSRNKLLLLSYSQEYLKKMGRLLSNRRSKSLPDLKRDYGLFLRKALSTNPKVTSHINVLLHAMGYFSKGLSHQEKSFFLDNLQKYREGRVPLLVNLNILKSWIIRFGEDYLDKQTFFQPYPEDLMQITFIYDKMEK
jgi:uncharacterized protein YbgA (DUF1722 family)/uncharacterized protein YbbK (DUF523 family)